MRGPALSVSVVVRERALLVYSWAAAWLNDKRELAASLLHGMELAAAMIIEALVQCQW